MMSTLIASTDERHPTYLYYDLESKRFIRTGAIGLGGTWITNDEAKQFTERLDVKLVAYLPDEVKAALEYLSQVEREVKAEALADALFEKEAEDEQTQS